MKRLITLIALATFAFFCALPATAQNAGYDLLQTGAGTTFDLSSIGLGVVALHGVPIMASLGNTDTIIHRDANGPGVVPLHVYALFMESNNPVVFNGVNCDLYVTINDSNGAIGANVLPQPDALAVSNGTATIRANFTFDTKFTVNADVIFVKAGTSVTNPANWVAHQPGPPETITATNASWSATPPAGYPSNPNYPSGGFYPKLSIHISGPHPVVPASCTSGATSSGSAIVIQKCVAAVQN